MLCCKLGCSFLSLSLSLSLFIVDPKRRLSILRTYFPLLHHDFLPFLLFLPLPSPPPLFLPLLSPPPLFLPLPSPPPSSPPLLLPLVLPKFNLSICQSTYLSIENLPGPIPTERWRTRIIGKKRLGTGNLIFFRILMFYNVVINLLQIIEINAYFYSHTNTSLHVS